MAQLSYSEPGLVIRSGGAGASDRQIRDLQRDLRRLGYLRRGIDGAFGNGTRAAVMALQYDLLANDGNSTAGDGAAPVSVLDYNRGRVVDASGEVDEALAGCIADMLDDAAWPTLPSVDDPGAANRAFAAAVAALPSEAVPTPFLAAVLTQESGLKHFHEPARGDEDTFITVGIDRNSRRASHAVTSRGYGAGQYTRFHHPPRAGEIDDIMLDPARNLAKAVSELREKFDHFVNGATSRIRADDRIMEFGGGPLRLCKYDAADPRHMNDCANCALAAGALDIAEGVTPLYEGSSHTYRRTRYYGEASYTGVPARANIGCDWPYAVRRYNGAGINSYHYQARVLKHLAGT